MTRRNFIKVAAASSTALAQSRRYDLLIRNGEVRDPSQSIRRRADVAVLDGKIAAIEDSIPAERAFEVIDARGLYVTGCGHDEIVKETRQTQQDGDGEWAIRLNGAY